MIIFELHLVLLGDGVSDADDSSDFFIEQGGIRHVQADLARVRERGTFWICSCSDAIIMNHHEKFLLSATTWFDLNPKFFLRSMKQDELNTDGKQKNANACSSLPLFFRLTACRVQSWQSSSLFGTSASRFEFAKGGV